MERLWKETEDRLPDALAAMDAGTLFRDPGHVSVIKPAIALHFARSKAAQVIHPRVWTETVARGRRRWMSENRALLEFLGHPDQSDVLQKLAASGADERHVVVIATQGQLGLHTAVDMGLASSQARTSAGGIDWLWVIVSQNLPVWGCYGTRQHGWATAVLAG